MGRENVKDCWLRAIAFEWFTIVGHLSRKLINFLSVVAGFSINRRCYSVAVYIVRI